MVSGKGPAHKAQTLRLYEMTVGGALGVGAPEQPPECIQPNMAERTHAKRLGAIESYPKRGA